MTIDIKPGTRLLGWDAAWTPNGSGAWVVVEWTGDLWFTRVLENSPVGKSAVEARMCGLLQEHRPALVAVDLPMGTTPVRGCRDADRETTRAFSRYGCPVHSPTPGRPGEWGDAMTGWLVDHGFRLATSSEWTLPAFMEVYPHTAALQMERASYRLPYKIQRAGSYYPDLTPPERKARVAAVFRRMVHSVQTWCDIPASRLEVNETGLLRKWKETEDRLDAYLCVWAAIQALQGMFIPYGNERGAIWNPNLKGLDPPKRML